LVDHAHSFRRNSLLRGGGKDHRGRVGRSYDPGLLLEPRQPGLDVCRNCFKGLIAPSDSRGPESLLFGYNDVQGGFEGPWPVRRPRQEEPSPQQVSQTTDRIARIAMNVVICRTFSRAVLLLVVDRQ
jgi:hypothetical protein